MAITEDPFTVTTTPRPTTSESILGLREQIFANAAVLFPQLCLNSLTYHSTGLVKPAEIFEIVIIGGDHKQALLLFGSPLSRSIAARGPPCESVERALAGLLDVTSEALSWYTETLLGELKHGEACAGGAIDFHMVEAGFHFSAEERLAHGV
ncbi:hypothetical protein CLAFUW4_09679 [Fulvia fulva]|uniref:Uncharacterized protein n=1 Tax=Passalora fulva TaxID=5499 RepID=A0A9Q8PGJ6_PASFU|nr:uncharacterized protein CLAFUR5_09773 [Fulvia fulva]KAK4614052.1 hypothetical protein CLAFUR4_09684 [Fulvia fulva]KAK4615144.1 hypothetical protein CLAFUR0_09675 [Fulvia fulva]UJO22101.1 hypothetical protein CLAFUR5_09773 [Fulvia fulva]WPV20050.1 hypothetical protein CLAFUW4_09679 [Fulvia fulva]WPV34876.1 hypothetical protein CLAFUW7_09680 [Fulvia fulva]